MKRKTWALLTLAALFAGFALLSALVVVIDPFQIYRLADDYVPLIDNLTQVYSNAGIARSYDYDSAIVGTSVTENFRPSQMEEALGGRFIKLCSSAGTAYNHALLMDLAFDTHDIKRIVYGLDVYSFVGALDETGTKMPLYLYDNNPFNDVQYWLNRSVLGSFLPRCLRTWGQTQDESLRDTMYSWNDQYLYGETALDFAQFTPPESRRSADAFLDAASANLNTHLIPFIEEHPETQFDIFFPPYSAAEWASMESKGTLDALLPLRRLCYDALKDYPNVRLYDFSAREDWVTDISNYKDALHYGQWINDAITRCIAAGENLVTDGAQIDAASEQLRRWAIAQIEAGGWIFD